MSATSITTYRIEIQGAESADAVADQLRRAGLSGVSRVVESRIILLSYAGPAEHIRRQALRLLLDPVVETAQIHAAPQVIPSAAPRAAFEIFPRPGVMDPVAESIYAELHAEGIPVAEVRTARRYVLEGDVSAAAAARAAGAVLANDCIEQVFADTAGIPAPPRPPEYAFALRTVSVANLSDADMERLSRDGHLFLSLDEMRAIAAHYRALGREPTDLELETIAQTWSEHCVHKTLKSAVEYHGAPFPGDPSTTRRYQNLLKDTIAAATHQMIAERRGPECLSVFVDNAGIIGFDDDFGIAFKVETHNHPSAIEPYGGAATGVGGCIRDVLGCGLGALPVANTDVFCVAPPDWPSEALPKGVLHPWRTLRGVVRGVADYGNRMGIPTVNGAVHFDPRYLANPLVYCGCVGLIPRNRVEKRVSPGDLVVVVGGRTGRDGIHGATFSSAELTDTHADEFAHAVQIGNAITERRVMDAVLRARDAAEGCLFSAITDCGAGGLSSAVGEMAADVGATIDLDTVPLKYAGLRYDEIWISEAQERMVLAVPPANWPRLREILRGEEVEGTVIGEFGRRAAATPGGSDSGERESGETAHLVVRFGGTVVGALDLRFLHEGLPKRVKNAEWQPTARDASSSRGGGSLGERLCELLRDPNHASKAWIIRQYDHEVQGGSVIKPLGGAGAGPGDAAVIRPRLEASRGIAIGCGLAPELSDVDPYWMAVNAIDEAIRNVTAVGGDPRRTAILDNFCWGRCDDPRQMGALVRACQACHDAALAYSTPFISGKDSLNNEFALDAGDAQMLSQELRRRAAAEEARRGTVPPWLRAALARIDAAQRLAIPGTLLISAMALVDDAARCVSSDLKAAGTLLLVGGLARFDADLSRAARVHAFVADCITRGWVVACHDVSEHGWLGAIAEMAIGGERGVQVSDERGVRESGRDDDPQPLDPLLAAYVVQSPHAREVEQAAAEAGVAARVLGEPIAERCVKVGGEMIPLTALRSAWGGDWPG